MKLVARETFNLGHVWHIYSEISINSLTVLILENIPQRDRHLDWHCRLAASQVFTASHGDNKVI